MVRNGEDANRVLPEVRDLVLRAVAEAIQALQQSRAEEGAVLTAVLREHGVALQGRVEAIAARAPLIPTEQRDRMLQRVRTLLDGSDPQVPVSESDLLREICLLSDRADVTEELNRLKGHLGLYDRILDIGGEAGRKLEFLLQEILRETNTIGSKGSDVVISRHVVEIKATLEKIRELLQNVE